MIIKNKEERHQYQEATKISTDILRTLFDKVTSGVYPIELDQLAGELCQKHKVQPAFLGVKGTGGPYEYNSCIYTNDCAVHGIPSRDRPIMSGDLVTVDFGIIHKGFYTDQCFTVGVGALRPADHELLEVGRKAVQKAVSLAVAGKKTGDLGYAMESTAHRSGFRTLDQYIGHGIGRSLHDPPEIPAWGEPGRGTELEKGMVLCIEAQVVAGQSSVVIDPDGWTVRTQDGSNAVMFEYMVEVGRKQAKLLTPTFDLPLLKN